MSKEAILFMHTLNPKAPIYLPKMPCKCPVCNSVFTINWEKRYDSLCYVNVCADCHIVYKFSPSRS